MFIFILNRLTMEVLLSVALNPSHWTCNSTLMQYSRYCGLENSLFNRIGRYCNFSEYGYIVNMSNTYDVSSTTVELSIEGPNGVISAAWIFSSASSRVERGLGTSKVLLNPFLSTLLRTYSRDYTNFLTLVIFQPLVTHSTWARYPSRRQTTCITQQYPIVHRTGFSRHSVSLKVTFSY